MTTIFSAIFKGDVPCHKVDGNDEFLAFLDINPLVEGHTLVIPKIESDYIFDLDEDCLAEFVKFSQRVAKKIKKATNCNRVAMVVLGMDVPHAHIHLIPMNSMDDVDFNKEKLKLNEMQFAKIADAISKA